MTARRSESVRLNRPPPPTDHLRNAADPEVPARAPARAPRSQGRRRHGRSSATPCARAKPPTTRNVAPSASGVEAEARAAAVRDDEAAASRERRAPRRRPRARPGVGARGARAEIDRSRAAPSTVPTSSSTRHVTSKARARARARAEEGGPRRGREGRGSLRRPACAARAMPPRKRPPKRCFCARRPEGREAMTRRSDRRTRARCVARCSPRLALALS